MEVRLRKVSVVTVNLERQSTKYGNVGLVQPLVEYSHVGQESWWEGLQRLWGPGYTLLDGQAAWHWNRSNSRMCARRAVRSSSSENSISDSRKRWQRIVWEKPWRKPLGKNEKRDDRGFFFHWTIETCGFPYLGLGRGWVEQRSCLQPAEAGSSVMCARGFGRRFLVVRWSHVGDDAEFESEIDATVGALEPKEEEMTRLKFLRLGNKTKTAMTPEKLNRVLRAPVRQHPNSTSNTENVPKPDLARLAGRTRWHHCREVGHFRRNYPKRRVQAPHVIWSCRRLPKSSRPTNNIWRSCCKRNGGNA